jgi:hypothetical protein
MKPLENRRTNSAGSNSAHPAPDGPAGSNRDPPREVKYVAEDKYEPEDATEVCKQEQSEGSVDESLALRVVCAVLPAKQPRIKPGLRRSSVTAINAKIRPRPCLKSTGKQGHAEQSPPHHFQRALLLRLANAEPPRRADRRGGLRRVTSFTHRTSIARRS